MSWAQVKAGDLIELENGYAFKSDEYTEGGHFLMRITNVQQGYISKQNPKYVSLSQQPNLKQFELYEGDMLMSLTGNVGRVGILQTHHLPAALNQRVARIKIKDPRKIDKNFLFAFLNSDKTRESIEKLANGAAQLNVSTKDIKSLTIPLPPLTEQKRIAAILDKADEIRRKREQTIAKLDQLAQSIFVEMFGDQKTNPKCISKRKLGELIKLKSGNFLPATAMHENGVYPVFGGNGVNGYHNEYMFADSKIVIGRVGVYCGCVHVTQDFSWVTDNALYVDEIDKELDFGYLSFALKAAKLNSVSSKSGQPLVSGSRIYPVEILVPPLEQQYLFSERIKLLNAQYPIVKAALNKQTQLFASLQHQAFTGNL